MEKQSLFKISFYPLGFLIFISILATLAGYPLYLAIGGDYSLERITSKLTLLMLLASIYPLSKLFHYSRSDLGFTGSRSHFLQQCSLGFLFGLLILGLAIVLELLLSIRIYDQSTVPSITFIASLCIKSLISALLIAISEEVLFRGLLFRFIQQNSTTTLAIIFSALFYGSLHFLSSGVEFEADETTLLTGFKIIGFAFANLTNPEILDSLLALFFVGLFLALVRSRKGSIAQCIGLHASWIFLIKTSKSLTDVNFDSDWLFLIGKYDYIIGNLVSGWLFVVIILYLLHTRKERFY